MYIRMRPKTCDLALQLAFLAVGAFMGAVFWAWQASGWWTLVWQGALLYVAFAFVNMAQVSLCIWFDDVEKLSPVPYSSIYSTLYALRSIYGLLSCCLLFGLYAGYGQKVDFIALIALGNWTFGNYAASMLSEKAPAPHFIVDSLGRAL